MVCILFCDAVLIFHNAVLVLLLFVYIQKICDCILFELQTVRLCFFSRLTVPLQNIVSLCVNIRYKGQ